MSKVNKSEGRVRRWLVLVDGATDADATGEGRLAEWPVLHRGWVSLQGMRRAARRLRGKKSGRVLGSIAEATLPIGRGRCGCTPGVEDSSIWSDERGRITC